jgi:outer membrane lipoprotein-sorting protein
MYRLFVKHMIFSLLFGFYTVSINAQGSFKTLIDVAGFKKKLQDSSKHTKTIKCDFVQEKNLSMLTKKNITKGHFWFKKPGNIRWEYDDPYSYLIILAKNKVFVKDDSSKKEYDTQFNKMFRQLGVMMFNFVQGSINACEKDFDIRYSENDSLYYLKMTPIAANLKEMLAQVDLYFDKKDFSVFKIKMLEPGGDYTSIVFLNKKLNQKIPDDTFSFK